MCRVIKIVLPWFAFVMKLCIHNFFSADSSPRRLYSTGEVTEKEYCHAKKVSLTVCGFQRVTSFFLLCFLKEQKGGMYVCDHIGHSL